MMSHKSFDWTEAGTWRNHTQWSTILPELIQKTKEGDIQYITIENARYSCGVSRNVSAPPLLRPSAALVQLIHDRCGTQKELSLRSGISEATISRMCSDDNFRYDIRQITRIVISLHMPPLLSAAFMEQTGFGTAVMTRYLRYQCIIACMFMDELDDVINSNRKLFE